MTTISDGSESCKFKSTYCLLQIWHMTDLQRVGPVVQRLPSASVQHSAPKHINLKSFTMNEWMKYLWVIPASGESVIE